MKGILEFDLNEPQDTAHHKMCVDSPDMVKFLWDVEQSVFRPHRKHGYSGLVGQRLNHLLETNPAVEEVISVLEDLYYEIKAGRFDYE